MKELDPGHRYALASFDGHTPNVLTFMKRNAPAWKYPGNENSHPGTQSQEVLRALVARFQYVNNQTPCEETTECIVLMRQAIELLESRHARRHGMDELPLSNIPIEERAFCLTCGHTVCFCAKRRFQIGGEVL